MELQNTKLQVCRLQKVFLVQDSLQIICDLLGFTTSALMRIERWKKKMYIRIEKEWFDKNQRKFTERAVKEYGNDPKQYYLITDEEVTEAKPQVLEIDKKYGVQLKFSSMNDEIELLSDWKPETDSVVALV